MKRVIILLLLAGTILASCNTARKAQQSTLTEPVVSAVADKQQKPQIVELDLTALFPSDFSGCKVTVNDGTPELMTDSAGWVTFEMPETDTLSLSFSPCPASPAPCTMLLLTSSWFIPYRYVVKPDGSVERKAPWVEFRRMPEQITNEPQFDFLCRSDYPAIVSINGVELKQYKTGIFFTTVKFNEGVNKVKAEAIYPDGRTASSEQEFIYEKRDMIRQPWPLWIDRRSIEPSFDLELPGGENVSIRFRGSRGQEGEVAIKPGKRTIKCFREDFSDYSLYRAELPLRELTEGKTYTLMFRLRPVAGAPVKDVFVSEVQRNITIWRPEDFPLLKVKNQHSRLTYNLGAPRLGGPIRQEFDPGVILKASGRYGDNYRIRLSGIESGYISADDVDVMPTGTVSPSYSITNMSCGPSEGGDILTIPYLQPVPYEVYPDPDQNRIIITLFGVETASTWVSHRTGRKIIDKITWEQSTPETYRIIVNLKTPDIWGYDLQPSGKSLVLRVKYPPVYDLNNEKPLSGLRIAIEAGHGGSGTGAIGLSGLVEKEINLDLSFRLGDICRQMGAEVIQVRDSDMDMTLTEKRDIAISNGADILISIHANAGGRGYLSVAGTSTYWHNPFWEPLAQTIYDRLLELDLSEFGVVGSFNYTVTRASQMPAILVEQAFMTHAEDEEKLADPGFRQQMAEKIYAGILDFLKYMRH